MMRSDLATLRSDLATLAVSLLFLGFCLAGCSRPPEGADRVSIHPGAQGAIPGDLRKALVEYWAARSRLDWPVIYGLEAPHVRWAFSEDEFLRLYRRAGKVTLVEVSRVEDIHPQVKMLALKLTLVDARTGKEETFYPKDRWIKVDGEWFHVWQIPFLDSFA